MSKYVRLCNSCKSRRKVSNSFLGFSTYLEEDNHTCPKCGNPVVDLKMTSDDYYVLTKISPDSSELVDAMLNLLDTDIIEYNLKMAQFRNQYNLQQANDSSPRCPHCGSTDIKSLSGLNRGASIAMWGIFSKKINKSFECRSCGYTW